MSLPLRGAWIEIAYAWRLEQLFESLPLRGAWIEMFTALDQATASDVAPPAGSVD